MNAKCIAIMAIGVLPLATAIGGELTSKNNPKLAKVMAAFPKSDTNGDKVLTISELRTFVSAKMPDKATSKTNPYLKRLLKEEKDADKNGDALLTKAELLAHLR